MMLKAHPTHVNLKTPQYSQILDANLLRQAFQQMWDRADFRYLSSEREYVRWRAPGVDNVTLPYAADHLDEIIEQRLERLSSLPYGPLPAKRYYIDEGPKQRPIAIMTVPDTIVSRALLDLVRQPLESPLSDCNFAYLQDVGPQQRVDHISSMVQQYGWAVQLDIKSYFDSIPHPLLYDRLDQLVVDPDLLSLVLEFATQPIREDGCDRATTLGVPQGGVISPVLANLYLSPLDDAILAEGWGYARYADDFVIFTPTKAEARRARDYATEVIESLGLQVHTIGRKQAIIAKDTDGFEFCGHFYGWFGDHVYVAPRRSKIEEVIGTIASLSRLGYRCDHDLVQWLTPHWSVVSDPVQVRMSCLALGLSRAIVRAKGSARTRSYLHKLYRRYCADAFR
ncbi:MAG: reverse transcriptase domain-containing protein [Peptococcales bacterium]|jgi:retron-type reverse transcriptase